MNNDNTQNRETKQSEGDNNVLFHTVSKLDALVGEATGLEKLRGFSWTRFLSAVLRPHSDEELYEIFHCGTPKTTPSLDEVNADWPTPWLFTRILVYGIILTFLFGWGALSYGNPNFYPALIMTVSLTVPLAVLFLFYELNVWRDVSMYNVIRALVGGGAVSLVITMLIPIFLPGFMSEGACWAGLYEETAKLLTFLVVLALARMRVNHILQGILLGGAVGAGFAAFETAGYVFNEFVNNLIKSHSYSISNDALTDIALLRGVLAPFCHVAWTAISAGVLCRIILKRRAEQVEGSEGDRFDFGALFDKRFLRLFLVPVILHFTWNGSGTVIYKYLSLRGNTAEIAVYTVFGLLGLLAWIILLRLTQEGISEAQLAKCPPPPQS